jgi:hypothetical protein
VTSLLSRPTLNEWGFVHLQAVCVCVWATSLIHNVTFRKESVITDQKKHFREDLILPELLSDNVSDVPVDISQ